MSGDKRNDQTYRAVCGKSPRTEPSPAPTTLDFHGSLNLLYGRVKSQNKLATMIGVPRRTLRRWLAGETPTRTGNDRARRQLVEESARRLIKVDDMAAITAVRRGRLTPTRETRVRGSRTVHITAWLRYTDEDEPRELTFVVGDSGAHGLASWVMHAVVDDYLNGATADDGPEVQNEGTFAPIAYAMTDEWYREAFLERAPDALGFDVVTVKFL
jgi:hypothetical protein